MWWTAFPTHQSGSVHCCNIKGFVRLIHAAYVTNKSYHLNMIMQLPSVCFSQFAAVQFSSFPRKVFDFNDFIAGRALDKLLKEPLMGSLSSTHKALTFVLWVQCQHIWFFFPIDEGLLFYSEELYFFTFFFFREELFDNPDSGASPDATKVLLLITDGNPSDSDRLGIIKTYEIKHIIRFVVMVSCAASCFFYAVWLVLSAVVVISDVPQGPILDTFLFTVTKW